MVAERKKGIFTDVLREFVTDMNSQRSRENLGMVGMGLYAMGRWTLGTILHPAAAFRAILLIGNEQSINRDVQTVLSLPKFSRGRQRVS